jgi:MFS family permease
MRRHDTKATIFKLYISNFLVGLVFWYGIEKLFMQHIGLNAADIGVINAVALAVPMLLDIPSGLLADRWSRKGILICAALFLGASGVTAVTSHSVAPYVLAYVFYGLYLVCTSGVYQAITYDVLHEAGRSNEYSKIMGREYALFLSGAGVANIASGFLATVDITLPYWLTLASCALNLAVLLTIREPTFHKKEQKEKIIRHLGAAVKTLAKVALLRSLVAMSVAMGVAELFKQDFSQLYLMVFTTSPILLGLLWAGYAFGWGGGHAIAYYLRKHLNLLIVISLIALIAMAFVHSIWGLAIMTVQIITSSAAYNLIETRIQNETPSAVRASVMSATTTLYRLTNLPMSFVFGWLIAQYGVFAAWQLIAAIAAVALAYWLLIGQRRPKTTV